MEFTESCTEARRFALSMKDPLVVHHYDADGLSSGSIVTIALANEGKKPRRRCIRKLDDNIIEELKNENEIIFVDLGGGNKRVNELNDVLIIDHHQTEGIEKMQINPLLFGIDGGQELSAAGTAHFVFGNNADLAVVGAVGDMQMPLTGMNKKVVERGVENGEIRIENDLKFYGRYCRSLVQFLAYSDDPYIPGISYREDKVEQLYKDLGIPLETEERKRVYADLNENEKTALISTLAKILISSKKINDLVGESYIFPKRPKNETYEANEFSTLLNACGRHGKDDIGVRVCMNDETAYAEARELLSLHRKMLRSGIEYAARHIQDLGKFYFVDGRGKIDESIIGIVCGMALEQTWDKPVIGVSTGEKGMMKVSGRSPRKLIAEGLNLGALMKESGEKFGGIGGGHRIAAGASLPLERINEFLVFSGEKIDPSVVE